MMWPEPELRDIIRPEPELKNRSLHSTRIDYYLVYIRYLWVEPANEATFCYQISLVNYFGGTPYT
jgi:hypothetical protein